MENQNLNLLFNYLKEKIENYTHVQSVEFMDEKIIFIDFTNDSANYTKKIVLEKITDYIVENGINVHLFVSPLIITIS